MVSENQNEEVLIGIRGYVQKYWKRKEALLLHFRIVPKKDAVETILESERKRLTRPKKIYFSPFSGYDETTNMER